MSIQIYALKRNFDVQKAERFFKERRVPYQLLDLKKHKLGQREMALFVRRLGAQSLVDRQNPDVLSHPVAHTDDAAYIADCLLQNPKLMRLPIVRNGDQVTLGADDAAWSAWLK